MGKSIKTLFEDTVNEVENIQNILLNEIEPHPENRKVGGLNKAKIKELAASIAAIGVQQPIIVRRKPGFKPGDTIIYQIIVGERRWRASGVAKQKTVPAVIRDLSDDEVLEIQFVENIQREDVHPLDESHNYMRMLQSGRYTIKLIAKKVGKSPTYVTQRVQLSKLTPECEQAYIEEKIPFSYAFELSRLNATEQPTVLKYILEHDWVNLTHLKERIHASFVSLKGVAFPIDSDLDGTVSRCDGCQERTSSNKELFDDFKEDKCINPVCFKTKADIYLKQLIKEFPGITLLSDGYDGHVDESSENIIKSWNWTEWDATWNDLEIPDKEKYKECVIADGPRKGKIVLAKIKETEPENSEVIVYDSPSDFLQEQTIAKKSYELLLNTLFGKVMGKLSSINLKVKQQLIPVLLEYIEKNKKNLTSTFAYYNCRKPENFRLILAQMASIDDLLKLCLALICESVIPLDHQRFSGSSFHELVSGLKIDVKKLEAGVREKVEKEYAKKNKKEDKDENIMD